MDEKILDIKNESCLVKKFQTLIEIKLNSQDINKGYSLLMHTGTVIYTGEKGRHIVPEKNLGLLIDSQIKFDIYSSLKKN